MLQSVRQYLFTPFYLQRYVQVLSKICLRASVIDKVLLNSLGTFSPF